MILERCDEIYLVL